MTRTVRRIPLARWVDPEDVFAALYSTAHYAYWLDDATRTGVTVMGEARAGTRIITANVTDQTVTTWTVGALDPVTRTTPVLPYLREQIAAEPAGHDDATTATFSPGWIGWIGFEVAGQSAGVPVSASRYPDVALLRADRAIEFDHRTRQMRLVVLTDDEGADAWAALLRDALATVPTAPNDPAPTDPAPTDPAPTDPAPNTSPLNDPAPNDNSPENQPGAPRNARPTGRAQWRHSRDEYLDLVRRCQDSIRAGNAYQLCLTNEIRVDGHFDPLSTYLSLRRMSPSHHGGFLRFGDVSLLSSSPEVFLTASSDGEVVTKPIKGTRPRSADPVIDQGLADEMQESEKERAENLMIVDLMRNDLTRIARTGTVEVTSLLAVESYPQVHQLVSTIRAQLQPGIGAVEAFEACFPAGSMSGAPKISALTRLHELEDGPRGIYSGAFGYFGFDGSADFAMVIRSIVLDGGGASIGTGGGITSGSIPEEEYLETEVKAKALLGALGVAPVLIE